MTKEKGVLEKDAPTEPKFSIASLGAHCRELFGCSSVAFAGATAGMEGEYTIRQMKEHIDAWSKKEAH